MNEDVNTQILAELRSLRRLSQYGAYSSFLFVLVAVAFLSWWVLDGQRGGAASQPKARSPFRSGEVWSRVSDALDDGDHGKAVSIAKDFVARRPNYWYAHDTLGVTYIAMGDFTNAELAYMRAFELYPDEATEKTLAAIRKRLADDRTRGAK